MTLTYFDYAMCHVRLAVLRTLLDAPGNQVNDSILATAMGELGLPVTRDQLRTQLCWLEEQQLLRLARPTDTLIVAKLRERGAEIATGRAVMDGVQRPSVAR